MSAAPTSIHVIVDSRGARRGAILWECKNARNWSDGWIAKLKTDQRSLHADVAVLVTASLPKDCRRFTMIDGVLVTDFACAGALAAVLRSQSPRARAGTPCRAPETRHARAALPLPLGRRIPPARRGRRRSVRRDARRPGAGTPRGRTRVEQTRKADRCGHVQHLGHVWRPAGDGAVARADRSCSNCQAPTLLEPNISDAGVVESHVSSPPARMRVV